MHVFKLSDQYGIWFRWKRSEYYNFLHLPELENARNRMIRVLVVLGNPGFRVFMVRFMTLFCCVSVKTDKKQCFDTEWRIFADSDGQNPRFSLIFTCSRVFSRVLIVAYCIVKLHLRSKCVNKIPLLCCFKIEGHCLRGCFRLAQIGRFAGQNGCQLPVFD